MQKPPNNEALRALFTLPPLKESSATAVSVPDMPPRTAETGDRELDAVLWLQSVVRTGNQSLIDKAMDAAKLIKTPMKTLEDRYATYLRSTGAHAMQIVFATVGFGDLKNQAERALRDARNRNEALARFGSIESLFNDTDAEKACRKALRGLKRSEMSFYVEEQARDRFGRHAELKPATIGDCLYARAYWNKLYWLRAATADCGDSLPQGSAHEDYCLASLAHIRPCNAEDAAAAFDHVYEADSVDWERARPILRNLAISGYGSEQAASPKDKHEEQREVLA